MKNDRNLIILHTHKDLEIKIERMWGMKTSTILEVIDAFIVISIAKLGERCVNNFIFIKMEY